MKNQLGCNQMPLHWSRSIISRNIKGVSKSNHCCTSLSCNCGILLGAAHSNSKSIPITREDSWSQSTITFCVQWWQHPFNRFSTLINSYSLQDAVREKDLCISELDLHNQWTCHLPPLPQSAHLSNHNTDKTLLQWNVFSCVIKRLMKY